MVGLLVRLLLSVTILGVIATQVDLVATFQIISKIGLFGFIAVATILTALALPAGQRWRLVIRACGGDVGFGWALRGILIGMFFNQFLPSSMGGDVVRGWLVIKAGLSVGQAVRSVILDRFMGMAMNIACSTIAILCLHALVGPNPLLWVIGAAVVLALAILVVVHIADLLAVPGFVTRFAERGRVLRMIYRLGQEAIAFGPDARRASRTAAIHVCSAVILLVHAGIIFLVAMLLGADISAISILLAIPPTLLLANIPVSFAGWGVREGAMIATLGLVGIPADMALAISILFGLAAACASAVGGIVWLLGGRRDVAEVRRTGGVNPGRAPSAQR